MVERDNEELTSRILEVTMAQRQDLGNLDLHVAQLSRRVLMASLVAYSLFAALCVAGALLAVRAARQRALRAEERARAARREFERRLEKVQAEAAKERKERAERRKRLLFYLNAFVRGEVRRALELEARAQESVADELDEALVAFVSRKLHERAARAALADGLAAFFGGRLKKALKLFEQGIQYATPGPLALKLRYYAGLCAYKQGDFPAAARHLGRVAASGDGESLMDDVALFRLGHANELLKHTSAARKFYRLLLDRYPKSPLVPVARAKLRSLPSGP